MKQYEYVNVKVGKTFTADNIVIEKSLMNMQKKAIIMLDLFQKALLIASDLKNRFDF